MHSENHLQLQQVVLQNLARKEIQPPHVESLVDECTQTQILAIGASISPICRSGFVDKPNKVRPSK